MVKPLSHDLRSRLIGNRAKGMSCRTEADRFSVAPSTAVRLVRRWCELATSAPRPKDGNQRSERIEAYASEILNLVEKTVDITQADIAEHVERAHVERFAVSAIWLCLERHAQTFKKNRARRRTREALRRAAAPRLTRKTRLDLQRPVFLNETGASTKMTRLCGRSVRGSRCWAAIPHGHWKTTTFVGGLRLSGMTAPMVLDGPMDGPAFLAWVEQTLVPTLDVGGIIVMDNLPAHKRDAVRVAMEATGATLRYLPPIRPTATPSRWPSRSSKLGTRRRQHSPPKTCGRLTHLVFQRSASRTARATSSPPDTLPCDRNLL
jgi:transposase